jgi:hypothetical protein
MDINQFLQHIKNTVTNKLQEAELARIAFQREQEQGLPLQRVMANPLTNMLVMPPIAMGQAALETTQSNLQIPVQIINKLQGKPPLPIKEISPLAQEGLNMIGMGYAVPPVDNTVENALKYFKLKGEVGLRETVDIAKQQRGGLQAGFVDPDYAVKPPASMANSNFKPIDEVAPDVTKGRLGNEPGKYLYHGTSNEAVDNIAKEGLKPSPLRGVSSLSKDETYSRSFAESSKVPKKEGQGVVLRVNKDLLKNKTIPSTSKVQSDQLNEILTKETIPPEALEIFKDGKWQPLKGNVVEGRLGDVKTLYHGTTNPNYNYEFGRRKATGIFQDGNIPQTKSQTIFLAENPQDAQFFADWKGKGNPTHVFESTLKPEAKIADLTFPNGNGNLNQMGEWQKSYDLLKSISKEHLDEYDNVNMSMQQIVDDPSFIAKLKAKGFDGVRFKEAEGHGTTVAIANRNVIIPKSNVVQPPSYDVLYHATPNKFDKFDLNRMEGGVAWFTDNPAEIKNNTVGAVQGAGQKLNIMTRTASKDLKWATPEMQDKYYTDQLIQMGYDGVKMESPNGKGNWYKVFDPNGKLSQPPLYDVKTTEAQLLQKLLKAKLTSK